MISYLKRAALSAVALLFLLPTMPARAGVLFMGGEDVSCQLIGTVTTSTSSTFYRSGYARQALGMSFSSSSDPPANRCLIPAFASQASGWIHVEAYQATLTNTSAAMNAIEIYGADGQVHWVVRGTNVAGQVKLSKRSTAGAYTDLATCTAGVWPAISLHSIDLHLVVSASGEFAFYVDGALGGCDFLGDTTTDAQTSFNQVDFGGTNSNNATNYWSEFIVSTDDTRGMGVKTCAPLSLGNAWNWSGGVANVNQNTINDANGSSTSSSGQIAEFACDSLPAGSFSFPALQLSSRLEVGTAGPQHDAPMVRPATGSTDYLGTNIAPTTAFANYHYLWATNPATSTGWSAGDFATGFNLGIESEP
jgi:hypothetical protein